LTDAKSFEAVKSWAQDAAKFGNPSTQRILIGNKADLVDRRVVTRQQVEQLAKEMGLQYFEASAKTSEGVSAAFNGLAELVVMNYQNIHGLNKKPLVIEEDEKISQGCCTIS